MQGQYERCNEYLAMADQYDIAWGIDTWQVRFSGNKELGFQATLESGYFAHVRVLDGECDHEIYIWVRPRNEPMSQIRHLPPLKERDTGMVSTTTPMRSTMGGGLALKFLWASPTLVSDAGRVWAMTLAGTRQKRQKEPHPANRSCGPTAVILATS